MSIDKDLLLRIEENDPSLTEIYISNPYSPIDTQDIVQLVKAFEKKNNPYVNKLFLGGNNIDDEGAKLLSNLTAIKYLALDGNCITDIGAQSIATMINLEFLNLADNIIGDKGFEQLLTLPKLTSLIIMENSFNIEVIEKFLTKEAISRFKELLIGDDSLDELYNPLFVKETNSCGASFKIMEFNESTEYYNIKEETDYLSNFSSTWESVQVVQTDEIPLDKKIKNSMSVSASLGVSLSELFGGNRGANSCATTSGIKDRSTSPFIK